MLSGAYTPQVQEAVTRLGSRMTFSETKEEMALMWGVAITTGTVRHITLRHGHTANKLIEEEVARLEAETPRPTAQPKQLVASTDGAMVQLTSGEWREVKMVAFGEFRGLWHGKKRKVVTKTQDISYFSRMEAAETFNRLALYEWQRRGGENAQRVVAVNDGALWIQSFIDYHCPKAIRVIDFAHAQGYLSTIGKVVYGAETEEFKQWFAQMSYQLGHQPPQRTVSALRLLQQQHADHSEITDIEQAVRYLEKRQPMIDYPHFRREQIPIGSGMVESGHKVVMQKRMKQAGMRWAEENVNPMLTLRMALCNQTWTENWQAIQTQSIQSKRECHLASIRSQSKPKTKSTVVTEVDEQRLLQLAKRIKPRKGWQNHNWIFPYRQQRTIHKN